MKKTYIAPQMEIKKFSVEDIMTGSALPTEMAPVYAEGSADEVKSVDYNQLFNIQ